MATLSEIIYNVKNLLAKGRQTDDELLSDRQYAFIINYYRAKLVREQILKGRATTPYIQNLGEVPLISTDRNECCENNVCIIRTEKQLPKAVTNGKEIITFVGTIYGEPYQRTNYQRSIWDSYSKYTSTFPKWYMQNDYIYITTPSTFNLKFINVQGIFSDPTKANEFRTCDCPNDEPCYQGFDYEYPLDTHLIDVIIKLMLQTELSVFIRTLEDESNDTRNTQGQQG